MTEDSNPRRTDRSIDRRKFIAAVGAGGVTLAAGCTGGDGDGGDGDGDGDGDGNGDGGTTTATTTQGPQVDQVNIGFVAPISGPWAYFGNSMRDGVEFAIDEINDNGGIEALGGAPLNLVAVDAGDSVDKATNAAQDLYSGGETISGAVGCVLSSFTLAATSVAERQQVPHLTLSLSDEIVNRGYNYTFKVTPTSSQLTAFELDQVEALAENLGEDLGKTALVADNTAASEGYRNALKEELPDRDIELAFDISWTPPISDATEIVRRLKRENIDTVWFMPTAQPDLVQLRQKMNELDYRAPLFSQGAYITIPTVLDSLGRDALVPVLSQTGTNMMKGGEDLVNAFTEHSGQPYMQEEGLSGSGMVRIIARAVEAAGSPEPQDVRDEIANMQVSEGIIPDHFPVDTVQFEDNGLIQDSPGCLTQWQDAGDASYVKSDIAAFTVAPLKYAQREARWPS